MAKLMIFCAIAVCVLQTYGLQKESMTPIGIAYSTPTVPGHSAHLAIDRNKETCFYLKPKRPRWWRIDLLNEQKILSVAVTMTPQDKTLEFTVFVIKTSENMSTYKRCASFAGKFDNPTVILSCAEGKGIEGQKVHIEDSLNREEGLFEICEVEVQVEKTIICDELEHLENGFIKLNNDSVSALEGTIAIHQCDPGYMLKGDFARTCLENGSWSGKHPQCKAATHDDEQNLQSQIRELQKNLTNIWTYIYDLKNVVSGHLKHLRVHQMDLESSVHRIEHLHEGIADSSSCDLPHSDSHHHSDDQSHGGDHSHLDDHSNSYNHSHGGNHSHHDDHSNSSNHSHGGNHSHHDDHSNSSNHSHKGNRSHHDYHSHSEGHFHSQNEHSHSDDHFHLSDHHSQSDDHSDRQTHSNDLFHCPHHDHHSHGDNSDHHGHHFHDGDHSHHKHSESHSHSLHDHNKEDHSSDHLQHKDSHETEDFSQHTEKAGADPRPVAEPVVVATNVNRQDGHGHHAQHDMSKKKNKTMELPTSADYNLYDFATCCIQPNKALPEDERQNVVGYVNFWQKKSGGLLNIHVMVQGFEMGDHHGGHGELQHVGQHMESLNQYGQNSENNSSAHSEHGYSPPKSHKHGLTVHDRSDVRNGCENTGLHYNPKNANHGGLMEKHVGDLGNIECDEHGVANLLFSDDVASLSGLYSIVGKSLVIHGEDDDLGKGDNPESLISGNSGSKIACCLIQKLDKLQLRYYKAMKTAKHYNNQ